MARGYFGRARVMLRDVARERYSSGARLSDALSADWPTHRSTSDPSEEPAA